MEDKFKYDKWTNEAFLFILRNALTVLSEVQDRAIYITFSTQDVGVVLPNNIKEKYLKKITIVLENEFWNLSVLKNHFKVTLIFDGSEKTEISVPFSAVISFSDKKSHVCFELNHTSHEISDIESSKIIFLDEYRNIS